MFPGVETDCIRKKKVRGHFGYSVDWIFPQLLRFDNDRDNEGEN